VDDITSAKARELSSNITDPACLQYINAAIAPLVAQHEKYIKDGGELKPDQIQMNAMPQRYQ